MRLALTTVKELMKEEQTEDVSMVSRDAVVLMVELAEQFIKNVSKNSMPFVKESGVKTLMPDHVVRCVDSLSLIVKNIPKVNKDHRDQNVNPTNTV